MGAITGQIMSDITQFSVEREHTRLWQLIKFPPRIAIVTIDIKEMYTLDDSVINIDVFNKCSSTVPHYSTLAAKSNVYGDISINSMYQYLTRRSNIEILLFGIHCEERTQPFRYPWNWDQPPYFIMPSAAFRVPTILERGFAILWN